MKITDVTTYIVGNPWKNWVFTRVDTDEGVHGIGEATLNGFAKTVETAIQELKRFVIGEDPFDVENHTLKLFREVYSDGGQIHGAALAGIEFACWDIIGKVTHQPVYKLIGGRCHDRLRVYANGWYRGAREPVPPQYISQMVEVAKRSPVPVACGEDYYSPQQFAELLSHDAVHIIQLEPQYLGLTASKQVCGMVHAHNGVTAPHSAQGPLCSLVCAHLNTATPNFFIHEIFDEFNEDWSRIILTNPVKVKDGYIELEEDRIGWGTDLNYEELAKHPYNPDNYLPLFRSGWERRQTVN